MFYDVYIDGKYFDTVFFSYRVTEEVAKRKIIEEGCPENIELRLIEN